MQIEHFIDDGYAVDFFFVNQVFAFEHGYRLFFNVDRESLFSVDLDNLGPSAAIVSVPAHLQIFKLAYDVSFKIEIRCAAVRWHQPQGK